ncbi:hypothetical protein [Streptomonospora litoralis]|uniref:Uncharacterized protein n=1 Tax=Streptomonospora litoralis TaxID=2498135 RepID=A0A4P6Q6D5_9ACTN|nr:hypothetical protein [Streptomonospora litoralis]QBI56326.1 hypothetical protein EKD16_22865 [Streptomonospora litoralis]
MEAVVDFLEAASSFLQTLQSLVQNNLIVISALVTPAVGILIDRLRRRKTRLEGQIDTEQHRFDAEDVRIRELKADNDRRQALGQLADNAVGKSLDNVAEHGKNLLMDNYNGLGALHEQRPHVLHATMGDKKDAAARRAELGRRGVNTGDPLPGSLHAATSRGRRR